MNNPNDPLSHIGGKNDFSDYNLDKSKVESTGGYAESCFMCVGGYCTGFQTVMGCPCGFECCGPTAKVREGFVGLVYRNGRLDRKLAPGLHFLTPVVEFLDQVDIRCSILNTRNQV